MTVHEIAALAGVSIGTVDRVLHKRGRVSAETKAKIEAIIEKYHFTPNPIARGLKRKKPYRFCALIPQRNQDEGYWTQIINGISRAAAEIKRLGVDTEIIEFDRHDPKGFELISAKVSAEKPDGLLFAPIMPDQTRPFIEKTTKEEIPFVFVDTDIPGTSPLCVIGQEPFKGGYLAGRLFHLFAGNVEAPIAVMNAYSGDYNTTRRRDGFLHYAETHHFSVIVKEYSDRKEFGVSEQEIRRFLGEQEELSGLFITNSMISRTALVAAERREGNRTFVLIGYDLTPENQRLLFEGRIDAIISQHPEEQGREALLTLFQSVVLGQKVESKREIPLEVYIKENVPFQGTENS